MIVFRRGEPADLTAIAAIQAASPGAAQWDVSGYLDDLVLVAVIHGEVSGFLVARAVDDQECDLLNLAVAPEHRRKGIGSGLVRALLDSRPGAVFLEVRESNQAARRLYKSLGFQEVRIRVQYYCSPPESGIVMKFFS